MIITIIINNSEEFCMEYIYRVVCVDIRRNGGGGGGGGVVGKKMRMCFMLKPL